MKHTTFEQVVKIDRTTASEEECATLPYVGLEHIDKDTGHLINGFTGDAEILLATKFKFTHKHVLYGKLRPYLNKVAMPAFTGICTTEILPLLPREGCIDRTYLWALLQSPSFINWASSSVSGANLPRLDPKLLAEYRLSLPPLPEQKRIATILEKADHLRRLRRYTLKLSDTYLQSVFLEMFGDPVTNPKQWNVDEISSVCTEIYRYPTFYGFQYTQAGIPVVRIGNILQDGHLSPYLEDYVFIDLEISKKFPRTILEMNDIVMAVRGDGSTVSRIGMISSRNLVGANMSPNLLMFRAKTSVMSPMYLFYLMVSTSGQKLLESYITRTAKKTITAEDIKQIKIPVPPITLQENFAKVFQRHERLQSQQKEAVRQAEHLFQTLLHQAFQGELTSGVEDVADVAMETKHYRNVVTKAYQVALPME